MLTTPGGLERMLADLTALGFRGPFDLSDLAATTARHGVRMLPPAADLAHD